MMKKILSVLIAAVMVLSMNCFQLPANAAESLEYDILDNGFSASGTNSFGTMFANAISQVQQEQSESNGYVIYSIEMLGNTAIVDLHAQDICTLIVGIYDEGGDELLGIGHTLVAPDSTQIYVDIETENMPQYFYLRGYLTDSETMRPNSTVFESSLYTREMQEFLSKTTDDFNPDRVLNLDENKDNNFAVYNDDVKIISAGDSTNVISKVDSENFIYTFENAESDIAHLVPGDIFTCQYDGEVLIVKVAEVSIDGTTVTVTGSDTELDDVFDYLRIEENADTKAFNVLNVAEGIEYDGIVEENDNVLDEHNNGEISPYNARISIGGDLNQKHSFKFIDAKIGDSKNKVEVSGSVTFGISGSVKAYISLDKAYVELRVDYSITTDVHIAGKAEGKKEICSFGFSPICGVYIDFTPSFIAKVDTTIEIKASINGTIGLRFGTIGFENLTCSPTIKTDCDFKGSVYLGFSFEPKVKILSDNIAFVKLTAEVGGTISGKIGEIKPNKKAYHTCNNCIDGDIIGSAKISVLGSILNDEDLTISLTILDINHKFCDFYYSFDKNTSGFTECPYWTTQMTIRVTDTQGSPLNGAKLRYGGVDKKKITASMLMSMNINNLSEMYEATFAPMDIVSTSEKGEYSFMINNDDFDGGIFIVEGILDGYTSQKFACVLSHKESVINVVMEPDGTAKKTTGISDGSSKNKKKKVILADKVVVGDGNTAVITTGGALYTSGRNTYHIVRNTNSTIYDNDNPFPLKIAENVIDAKEVFAGMGCVTADNILHTWGGSGNFGPDDDMYFKYITASSAYPNRKEIMVAKAPLTNIKSIVSGGLGEVLIAVVTTSDELYLCGGIGLSCELRYGCIPDYNGEYNSYGKFFEKVMDNVSAVSIGEYNIAAVTKDGSLYIWGKGPIGDGTWEDRHVPTKIMDNISSVSLGNDHGAAVTNNGELYMWGNNMYGALGVENSSSGSFTYTTPIRVMDNIASVSLANSSTAVVTQNGELYVWGGNAHGVLGDGSTTVIKKPKKIMDNVSSVSLGTYHSAAIKTDGSVWVWGHNYAGQFGNGTTSDSLVPIKFVIPQETEPTGLVFSVPDGFSPTQQSQFLIYDSTKTVSVSNQKAAATTKQASFTDLVPNSIYNFYSLRSDMAKDPLTGENVLFVAQCVSDSMGELTVNYPSDVEVSDSVVFVKGMERIDINNANVYTFPRYADEAETFAVPMVYYNDILLTLGKDYTIDGVVSSETPGKYTIMLSGRGDFTGLRSEEWELLSLNGDTDTETPPPHTHIGGKATCVLKAVCSICGKEYGTVDLTNHVNTKTLNAKPATETEDGYTGDTICEGCGNIEKGIIIPKTSSTPSGGNSNDTSGSTSSTPIAPNNPTDSSNSATSDITSPNTSSGENTDTSSGNNDSNSKADSNNSLSSSSDLSNTVDESNKSPNPSTGITFTMIPLLLAVGSTVIIAKNKKR